MPVNEKNIRSVRSFVRRSGRITPAQKNALENYWPLFGIDYAERGLELPAGYEALKLEIGIGNGDALISMAAEDPSSLYLGIEVHTPGIGRCLNLVKQRQLDNVRLIQHDAIEVLQQMVAPASLDRLLLFFPDPWHKKRHHKRRIVDQMFRDLAVDRLKPGGVIHIATDWREYAESIAAQFLDDARFSCQGGGDGFAECPEYRPATRFEQRGRRLGHGVWDLLFVKTPDSS